MHSLRVFFVFVKYLFKARLEYPRAYLFGIIANWAGYAASMVMIFIMVWSFGTLASWEPDQVIFMYAVWLLAYAIGASFSYSLTATFRDMAINGTLDEAYTRPVSPFLYLLSSNYNVGYVSQISLSAIALGFSIVRLGISFTAGQWLWFVVTIVCGAIINACMMIICELPAIRTRSKSPTAMFFWNGREFTMYPLTVYPRWVMLIFTTVLPFGFTSFYPIQVLLGRQDGILPHITIWLSPIVSIVLIFATAGCWRIFTNKYESAGT